MLIANAQIEGRRVDVRIERGVVAQLDQNLVQLPGEEILDACGGTLLRGLHDHHIHLYATAAARVSVSCGPPDVCSLAQLAEALRQAPGSGWLRGVGYHDSVAGALDRWQLDEVCGDRPLRIQHRSGVMWLLNSLAIECLQIDAEASHPGIERDSSGRVTGRLLRMDDWLGKTLARRAAPDLSMISGELAACGVTGVTDASATNSIAAMRQFAVALEQGQLLQRVLVMGDQQLPGATHPLLRRGPLKILLDAHRLPDYAQLLMWIRRSHDEDRPVAIHCVTRTELVFALSALLEAGQCAGDRIEHASVAPDEVLPLMQAAGITVVTQPGFVYQRGDQYLRDVAGIDQPWLYRGQGFIRAGIPLAGSSDAPYGSVDPWLAMRAATERLTAAGVAMNGDEQLNPEQALALFTGDACSPGQTCASIAAGDVADFCLLDRPWSEARLRLDRTDVLVTLRGGEIIYRRQFRSIE
jgi:predicted amidohydrolase YtcJ